MTSNCTFLLQKLRIRRLGRKNRVKNSEGDFIRRALAEVLSNKVAKQCNWLGRRDKRLKDGAKEGIGRTRVIKTIKGS